MMLPLGHCPATSAATLKWTMSGLRRQACSRSQSRCLFCFLSGLRPLSWTWLYLVPRARKLGVSNILALLCITNINLSGITCIT